MGGRGAGSGKSGGGGASTGSVSMSTAESLVRDEPGFGSKSRILGVEVLRTNPDGTVDLKFTYNTTPGRGQEYSEDVTKIIKKVRTN